MGSTTISSGLDPQRVWVGEATEGQSWGPGLGTCSSGRSRRLAAEWRLQWQQWSGCTLVILAAEGGEGKDELHWSVLVWMKSLMGMVVVTG